MMTFAAFISIVLFLIVFVLSIGILFLPFVNYESHRKRGSSVTLAVLFSIGFYLIVLTLSVLTSYAVGVFLDNWIESIAFFKEDHQYTSVTIDYIKLSVGFTIVSIPQYVYTYLLSKK